MHDVDAAPASCAFVGPLRYTGLGRFLPWYRSHTCACDEKEKQIIARAPTTKEKDEADIAHVRSVCDKLFGAFERARTLAPLVKEFEAIK